MNEKIQPALTAEEWAICWEIEARYGPDAEESAADEIGLMYGKCGVAAWALHGQPFGFTWEDVDLLREHAQWLDDLPNDWSGGMYRRLADRIAALLPPREP